TAFKIFSLHLEGLRIIALFSPYASGFFIFLKFNSKPIKKPFKQSLFVTTASQGVRIIDPKTFL
ncbi:hypothetical protein, partial [Marinicella rhabdoformis]|uniref:hypothetical protein n=1 Tax=Marinicella rhabdoformis TaxID=2580566 RepID=UPI001C5555D3